MLCIHGVLRFALNTPYGLQLPNHQQSFKFYYRAQGNRDFAYDNAGNPIARTADDGSSQMLSFNNANRLDSINVNGGQTATYTYNPLGQRVVKELANGDKEIYHYDEAGQLIAVVDGAGNRLREYIYWDGKQVAMVRSGNIYYIHNDHLNTPQVITDANQQVVWMANYEPFGKLAANQTNSIEVYSRFPGQYLDSETGLYYNYFRDYDPSIGRYIESDPIGLGGGINTYGYVLNNPLNYADPTGQNPALVLLLLPEVGEALSGALALAVAAWSETWEKPDRSPEDELHAQADYEWAKTYCDTPPPPGGDICETLDRQLKHAEQCITLMAQFDNKWGPSGRHASKIESWENRVKNIKEAQKANNCDNNCPYP